MKIWKLKFEVDRYDNLAPIKDFTWEEFQEFDGRRLRETLINTLTNIPNYHHQPILGDIGINAL